MKIYLSERERRAITRAVAYGAVAYLLERLAPSILEELTDKALRPPAIDAEPADLHEETSNTSGTTNQG